MPATRLPAELPALVGARREEARPVSAKTEYSQDLRNVTSSLNRIAPKPTRSAPADIVQAELSRPKYRTSSLERRYLAEDFTVQSRLVSTSAGHS